MWPAKIKQLPFEREIKPAQGGLPERDTSFAACKAPFSSQYDTQPILLGATVAANPRPKDLPAEALNKFSRADMIEIGRISPELMKNDSTATPRLLCEACDLPIEAGDRTEYRFPEEIGGTLGEVTVRHSRCGKVPEAIALPRYPIEGFGAIPKVDLG